MWKIILLAGQLSTGTTGWFTSNASFSTQADCVAALPDAIIEAQARMEAVPDIGVVLVDGVCQKQTPPGRPA